MEELIIGLKIYALAFVGIFLLGIAINLTTKKEYRSSLKKIWLEHIQMFGLITVVGVIVLGLAWFLFRVI
ncbi:hypothetical protein M2387_000591 [Klebsiella sp. BIGb0407]|nr:hypothetical protein [Klebsiella sp. BIGb0407]